MRGSASGVDRLLHCPASARLAKHETSSEYANRGTEAHADLAADPGDFAYLVPPGARHEVKVIYNVRTRVGRILGEGADRSYGQVDDDEITGSIDVLGVVDGYAVVIDWKTGHSEVESAATNPQLLTYAVAATSALGLSYAKVVIVYTQTGRVDAAAIGPLEIAEFSGVLATLPAAIDGSDLSTNEGAWCKYCPSKAVCPSKLALLAQVQQHGLADLGSVALSPLQAYQQVAALDQLVKDARRRLDMYVDDNGPIDLGNGKAFGRYVRKGNEKLDGVKAVQAIQEVTGEHAEKFVTLAADVTVTKAGLKRAAESLIATKPTKMVTAVLDRLRELGGISSAPTRPIGEYAVDRYESAHVTDGDVASTNQLLETV